MTSALYSAYHFARLFIFGCDMHPCNNNTTISNAFIISAADDIGINGGLSHRNPDAYPDAAARPTNDLWLDLNINVMYCFS